MVWRYSATEANASESALAIFWLSAGILGAAGTRRVRFWELTRAAVETARAAHAITLRFMLDSSPSSRFT